MIGKTSYNIGAGKTKTVKVKITNAQARKQLKKGKTLKARYSGPNLTGGTVKLKQRGHHKKHGHHKR